LIQFQFKQNYTSSDPKKVTFEFLEKALDCQTLIGQFCLNIFQILKALEKMLIIEKVNKINFICPLFPNFDQKKSLLTLLKTLISL